MDETWERLNLRTIKISTRAALQTADDRTSADIRLRAQRLLDEARKRPIGSALREEVDRIERQLVARTADERELR